MRKVRAIYLQTAVALCIAGIVAGATLVMAQEGQREQNRQSDQEKKGYQRLTLPLPPEQSVMSITALVPEQVEKGEPFDYSIIVHNATRNVAIHDIALEQHTPQGLSIQSVDGPKKQQQEGASGQRQAEQKKEETQQQGQQPQAGKNQAQQDQQQAQQAQGQQVKQEEQGQQEQQGQQGQPGQQGQQGEWKIDRLEPGDMQVIRVTASMDQTGEVPICVVVKSYHPAICFTTNIVSREMQLAKRAPESVSVCEPIELEYFVQNEGTVAIDRFTIQDDLGDHLITKDGQNRLEFAVDGLPAGETRKFVATVFAKEPGTASSRAVATLQDGENVRSSETRTEISQPDLAIAMDGPQTQYVGNRFSYTVRVTNRSQIAAPDVDLVLMHPQDVRLLQVGEPRRTEQAVSGGNEGRQPTRAARQQDRQQQDQRQQDQRQQDQQQQAQQQQGQQQTEQNWERRSIELGSMEPNETRALSFTVAGNEAGMMNFRALASMVCGEGETKAQVQAVAMQQTEIIALPALAIYVADEQDPVPVDDEFIYTVTVVNEGQAVDSNVELSVEVPDQLEIVKVEGTTEGEAQQNQVKFQPIEQLQPGDKAEWQVRTKVTGGGEAVLRARVTSQGTQKGAIAEEPTRLVGESEGAQRQESKSPEAKSPEAKSRQ